MLSIYGARGDISSQSPVYERAYNSKRHRRKWRCLRRSYEQTCKPSSVLLIRSGSHLSRAPVAWRLKRLIPEGLSGQRHLPPIRSCSGWGLPSEPVTRPLVRSYRTVAPLPQLKKPPDEAVFFCGTFLRVTPTGRYPAPCPAELGLSSKATFAFATAQFTHIMILCSYFSTKLATCQKLCYLACFAVVSHCPVSCQEQSFFCPLRSNFAHWGK
jgi:hypothetical protein